MSELLQKNLDPWMSKVFIPSFGPLAAMFGFILYQFLKPLIDVYGILISLGVTYIFMTVLFCGLFRHKRDEAYTKKFKSAADVIWNFWSFWAIVVLSSCAAHENIIDILRGQPPLLYAFVLGTVLPAAAVKIAVSAVEYLGWDKSIAENKIQEKCDK